MEFKEYLKAINEGNHEEQISYVIKRLHEEEWVGTYFFHKYDNTAREW